MEVSKSPKSSLSQNNLVIIAVIVVIAVVVAVVGVILLNNNTPTASTATLSEIPNSRTSDGGFVLGDPEAPITIIEFADYACPHCQDYHSTMTRFIDEFVATGQAKFEYRMFISGADPIWGEYTAQLSECAAEQQEGGFWSAHAVLFEIGSRQGRFNEQTARTLAERLGLNYSELLNCAGEADQYQTDVALGSSLQVASTPTIMVRVGDAPPQFITVNGQTFNRGPVPYEVLQGVVNGAQG